MALVTPSKRVLGKARQPAGDPEREPALGGNVLDGVLRNAEGSCRVLFDR